MSRGRAFCTRDLAGLIVGVAVFGAILIGMAPIPNGPPARTYENLRTISQAAHFYQMSNQGYLPMVLSYPRGISGSSGMEGWCTWSFGGKNNNAYWGNRAFDVEAADRPLTTFLYGDDPFYAPAPPARLPASHPSRAQHQAEFFRDPGDDRTFERNWPNANTTISTYDDVGTSYLTNMVWFDQLANIPNFVNRFNEGTRRIAAGERVDPARFVWLSDPYATLIFNSTNPRYRLRSRYGDYNAAPMLFLDGHASYEFMRPNTPTTGRYNFRFK